MLFKEAFHIYGSFFETNKDEEAFRDILLHSETGLSVVIVTHPVTLERFVVLFLNHFTQEFPNWPRRWALLLLNTAVNIRLHVKGFNKLIYIGTFK